MACWTAENEQAQCYLPIGLRTKEDLPPSDNLWTTPLSTITPQTTQIIPCFVQPFLFYYRCSSGHPIGNGRIHKEVFPSIAGTNMGTYLSGFSLGHSNLDIGNNRSVGILKTCWASVRYLVSPTRNMTQKYNAKDGCQFLPKMSTQIRQDLWVKQRHHDWQSYHTLWFGRNIDTDATSNGGELQDIACMESYIILQLKMAANENELNYINEYKTLNHRNKVCLEPRKQWNDTGHNSNTTASTNKA